MAVDKLISQDSPSLINGVSRQPAAQRLPSQCEEQTNMISDVALGVARRPPAEHIAILGGPVAGAAPTGGYYTHLINRGDGQQFVAIIEDGDVNVYNLTTGAEVTVTDAADGVETAYTYLDIAPSASVTAENSFEAITVADYTFIVNKRKAVAMSGSASAGRTQAHEFMFFAKAGQQNYEDTSIVFGATAIAGAGPGDLGTSTVIDNLCTLLGIGLTPSATVGVTAGSTNWKFTREGKNLLYGYQFQNALEEVKVSIGNGETLDKYVFLATSTAGDVPQTPSFSALPYVGVDGFVIKISGTDGSAEDEYYVKYNKNKKIWEETRMTSLDNSFDSKTMPHALVYSAGAFTFQPVSWSSRLVGDNTSAPQPSFVGTQIKGITQHKNRLMVIADENVIATEAGNVFNFWPTTATTLVDSDPFDIAGTTNRVSLWDYMVNFEGAITLFSSVGDVIGEVVGSADVPLTIKNARVEERATYAFSPIRPVVLGTGIHFVLDRGGSSAVYRYAKTDIYSFRADEITGHVRGYIPPNVAHMKSCAAQNLLVLRSEDEPYNLYVYRTHTIGQDQVMASWSKWTFSGFNSILNFDFIESTLYLLDQRTDGLHLIKFDFGKDDEDNGAGSTPLGFRVYLDDLVSVTGSYSAVTGYTTFTLPYSMQGDEDYMVVKGGAWGATRGAIINGISGYPAFPTIILAEGDYSAHPVYIGRVYESLYQPTEPALTGGRVTGSTPGARITGRLQVYRGRILFLNTGAFDAKMTSTEDGEEYVVPFRTNKVTESAFGPVLLETGVFNFPVGGDSRTTLIKLVSDTYLPCSYTAYEWEGRYVQRSDSA